MLFLLLMSPNLSTVFKERMIIFNLKKYYINSWLNIRGNGLNNQTNIKIMALIMYDFLLISMKFVEKIEKRPQHSNFCENLQMLHYTFLRVLQDKNCENDLYFYAFIFLMCQLGSSFYALFILLFMGKLTFPGN